MSRDHLTEVKELIDKYENCYNKEIALKYAQELMRYHARWAVEQAEHNKMYESAAEKANGVIAQTNEENLQVRKRVQELEEVIIRTPLISSFALELTELREENKRLREALEEIAKETFLNGDSKYATSQKLIRVILKSRRVLEEENEQ